jgi:hypothetical protein
MPSTPKDDPEYNNIQDILDALCQELDDFGYHQQLLINTRIDAVRRINPDCADELEREFQNLIAKGRYGVGASFYTKTSIIRPIQRKYKE